MSSSAKRAYADVKYLSARNSRLAGTLGDRRATEYVIKIFEKSGLGVQCEEFEAPSFIETDTRLRVISPDERDLRARAMLYTVPTCNGGIRCEAAYAGYGRPEDLEGVDVRNKIAVIERTPNKSYFGNEICLASRSGAEALVMVNNDPLIFIGTTETGLYASDRRFEKEQSKPISAVGISRDDGTYLIRRARETRVVLNLRIDADCGSKRTANIVGMIKGSSKPNEKIVVVAHRDSTNTSGANDNASGTAVLLELSRVLPKHRPERTIELVSLGAEEVNGQLGALHYCRVHRDKLRSIKALINVDMVAVGSRLKIVTEADWPDKTVKTSSSVNRILMQTAKELGYSLEYGTCHGSSDEGRFIDFGVPSAWLFKPDDAYYHSEGDTIDRINPNDLKIAADIVGSAALRISNK